MKTYQEENPNNSRIFINYNNKDNPVRFEYVKKDGVFKIIFGAVFWVWEICLVYSTLIIVLVYLLINFTFKEGNQISQSFNLKELYIEFIQQSPQLFILLFIVSIPFVLTLIIYYNKKLWVCLPYLNSFYKSKHYVFFDSKDVIDNKLEIPLFANVLCDYKAEGEFSKYLERFEIVEHPFKIYNKKGKSIPNEYLWKATWYFSNKPKSGILKAKFY